MHSKGNYKPNEKKTEGLGENIHKWCDWQGLDFQNIQTAHTTQYPKKLKQPNQKIGRRPK